MAAPRKRTTKPDEQPAAQTPGDESAGPGVEPANPAPLTPPDEQPGEDNPGTAGVEAPAPLTPPGEQPKQELGREPVEDEPTTDAAPLSPPAQRDPEPEVKQTRTSPPPPPAVLGQADTLDLRWPDGSKADPDALFTDPGARFTYVLAPRRVMERHYYSGATTPTNRLLYPAGAKVDRSEADRIRARMASS